MYVIAYPLIAASNIIASIIWLYTLVIFASVIMSFFRDKISPYHPVMRILIMLTEPVYQKVRPYIPNLGGIDLAPLAILLLLSFVEQGILPVITTFAQSLIR